jgi:hypothetical protein
MTATTTAPAANLIDQCRRRGIALYLDGDELRFRGPRGAMTQELRQAVANARADLIARLRPIPADELFIAPSILPPCPPKGAVIFGQDERGRPAGPEAAYMWTWPGVNRWYYVREHPIPDGHPIDGTRW